MKRKKERKRNRKEGDKRIKMLHLLHILTTTTTTTTTIITIATTPLLSLTISNLVAAATIMFNNFQSHIILGLVSLAGNQFPSSHLQFQIGQSVIRVSHSTTPSLSIMAGTLQTLIFRSPTSPNGVSHPWKPSISPSHLKFPSSHSIVSSPNSSLHPKLRPCSQIIRASKDHNQVGGNEAGGTSNSSKLLSWTQPLSSFVSTNFLPLALVSGVVLGLTNPNLGCLAHRYSLSKFSTFGIFLISGLVLRSEDIGAASEAWPAGLFGLASILLFSPYFSRLILQLKLAPQEFVTGLAIFLCMPTTLSSGVALTQLVGGNSALALAMTVISNLLGICIVPFSISKFIADGVGVSVPVGELFISLITTLLVPLILGKVFRDYFDGVAEFVDQNRKILSMSSAILLSLVPWIQVSRSRSLLLMVKPTVFLTAIGMATILHLILLALNALAAKCFSVAFGGEKSVFAKKENSRALILVASQKTLPVMVAVVEQLHGALGVSGLLVLPCVVAHINQIVIDSVLVNLWLRKDYMNSLKACES